MKTRTLIILNILIIWSPFLGKAQPTSIGQGDILEIENLINQNVKGNFGFDIEQDWFLDWIPNTNFDRNYTQGTGFIYTKPELDKSILFAPFNILEWLNSLNGRNQNFINFPSSISFGVTAFTPEILDNPTPIIGDRPFAGMIFLSTIKNRYNIKSKSISKTSLTYGMLGTNITNTFQSFAHKHIIKGRPTNISWDQQISEGGSFAFLFSHSVIRSILSINMPKKTNSLKKWFDLSLGSKIDIGWYTGISTPIKVKVGLMSPFSLASSDITVSTGSANQFAKIISVQYDSLNSELRNGLHDPKSVEKLKRKSDNNKKKIDSYNETNEFKTWDIYFFASMTPRITPYNSLILGQPHISSIYTLDYEDYNPFVVEFEYGIVISRITMMKDLPLPVSHCDLILSINDRSPEIRNDEYRRWHHWGRVSLRFPLF